MYCFGKFCLLCTTETKNLVYLHTRSDFDINTNYMDMIEVLYPKLIELNSSLPDFICKICLAELLNSYLFYQKCQRTEQILIKYMKDMLIPQENTSKRRLQYSDEMSTEFFFKIKKMKYSQSLTRTCCSNNLGDLDDIDTDFKSLDHISNASTILLADYEKEIEKRISNMSFSDKVEKTNPEKSINKIETIVYYADISETESNSTKSTDCMIDDGDYSSEITNSDSASNSDVEYDELLHYNAFYNETNNPKELNSSVKVSSEIVTKRPTATESGCNKNNNIEFPEFDESCDTTDFISPQVHNDISNIVLRLEFDKEIIAVAKNNEIINNNNHSILEIQKMTSLSKTIPYADITCNNETDCCIIETSENQNCTLDTEKFLEHEKDFVSNIKDKHKTLQPEFKSIDSKSKKKYNKEKNIGETSQQIQKIKSKNENSNNSTIKETNNNDVINSQQQNKNKIVESKEDASVKNINNYSKTIAPRNKNKTSNSKIDNNIENKSSTTTVSQQYKTQQLKSTSNCINSLVKNICEKIISEKQQTKFKYLDSKSQTGVQISLKETNNREITISHMQPKMKNGTSNVSDCKNRSNRNKIISQQQPKQPTTTRKLESKNQPSIKSYNNEENNSNQINSTQQKHQQQHQQMKIELKNKSEKSVQKVSNCSETTHKRIEKFESKSDDVQNSKRENNHDNKISEVLNLTKTFSEIEVLPLKEPKTNKIGKKDDVSIPNILNLPEIVISLCNNKTP